MRWSYLPYKIVVSHSGLKCLEKMKCIVIILESLSWVANLNWWWCEVDSAMPEPFWGLALLISDIPLALLSPLLQYPWCRQRTFRFLFFPALSE